MNETKPSNNDIYQAMSYIFNNKSTISLPPTVIVPVEWTKTQFENLERKENFYKSLPFFYKIWCENKVNNCTNFKLTPLIRLGRIYVHYEQFHCTDFYVTLKGVRKLLVRK